MPKLQKLLQFIPTTCHCPYFVFSPKCNNPDFDLEKLKSCLITASPLSVTFSAISRDDLHKYEKLKLNVLLT